MSLAFDAHPDEEMDRRTLLSILPATLAAMRLEAGRPQASWLDFGLTSTPLCGLPQHVYSTGYITPEDIVIHTHSPGDSSPRFRYDPYGLTGVEFRRVSA